MVRSFIFICLGCALLLPIACDDQVTVKDNCGDTFIDPGEDCDGVNLQGATCQSLGYYNELAGQLSCTAACAYDVTGCGHRCGDGTVETAEGEACDDTNLQGQTCQSLGYGGGTLTCGADCRFVTTACTMICGDGHREPGEACDDRNTTAGDGCAADCTVETGWDCGEASPSVCRPVCGDCIFRRIVDTDSGASWTAKRSIVDSKTEHRGQQNGPSWTALVI